MRSVVLCATLAALVSPAAAGAQPLPLSEAEALARLSANSPRVRAIRAAIELARADALAAGRWPNPRVTIDREWVAGNTEYLTMVGQLLPLSGQRRLQVQAASALVDAASSRADDAVRRARADLQTAFAQLTAAQAREHELTSLRDRLRGLADILAKREAAGDAAGFDRLRAEREVLDVDADRATAATDRARAQATLAAFFDEAVEPSRLVAVGGETPLASDLPTVETLMQSAESTRGELTALRKEAEAANFSSRAADRRRLPEPEIIAGTKSASTGNGDVGSVLTFQAVVPLFDRGSIERAMATARASQAVSAADALRVTLRAEITALRAAVLERRATAERYRASAVANVEQLERIAQVSYDAGERGILELLDAYRSGVAARIRQATLMRWSATPKSNWSSSRVGYPVMVSRKVSALVLVTSTLLNMVVVPTLYLRYGEPGVVRAIA
jgi:cobalt-zinc-cadmium efflux system outer membrane protein